MFSRKNLLMLIAKHALIATVVALVCSVIIILVSKEIDSIVATVLKNKQLASTLEQRTALLTQLDKDAQLIGTNNTTIEQAFLPSDNIIDFISALESLAQKRGVQQTFRFDSPTAAQLAAPFPLQTISYHNTLVTNTPTFTAYLKDLERLPFFAQVGGLSITAQTPRGIVDLSNATYRGTLYAKGSQQ